MDGMSFFSIWLCFVSLSYFVCAFSRVWLVQNKTSYKFCVHSIPCLCNLLIVLSSLEMWATWHSSARWFRVNEPYFCGITDIRCKVTYYMTNVRTYVCVCVCAFSSIENWEEWLAVVMWFLVSFRSYYCIALSSRLCLFSSLFCCS